MSNVKTIALAEKAEPKEVQKTKSRHTWCDSTLVWGAIISYTLGIATVVYVNHYAPTPADAATNEQSPNTTLVVYEAPKVLAPK